MRPVWKARLKELDYLIAEAELLSSAQAYAVVAATRDGSDSTEAQRLLYMQLDCLYVLRRERAMLVQVVQDEVDPLLAPRHRDWRV